MSTKNLIKNENRFLKTYTAKVVSNEDPLRRGRLQVLVDAIMGDIPFWVDSTLVAGKVQLILIPEPEDLVKVKFRNKDIYSGEWSLGGSPNAQSDIDPKKYGLKDEQGNLVIIDRATNDININSMNNFTLNAASKGTMTYGGDLNLTAPNVTITGNTTIKGTLTVTDTCVFEGIAWKPHVHPYTWTDPAGSGDTGAPK